MNDKELWKIQGGERRQEREEKEKGKERGKWENIRRLKKENGKYME